MLFAGFSAEKGREQEKRMGNDRYLQIYSQSELLLAKRKLLSSLIIITAQNSNDMHRKGF